METKNKHIFWEALILAIFLLGLGIFLGYFIEANRTSEIISSYQQSELSLLDMKIQDNILSLRDLDCASLFEETVAFADRTYQESAILARYEDANEFGEGIIQQHKKYDLLRTSIWINTLKLKEKCHLDFNTVVYFYDYLSEDVDIKSLQSVISKKLEEVKQKEGSNLVLIPIAGNLNLNSVNYLMKVYNITSLPSVLINENVQINTLEGLNSIESHLN